MEARYLARLRQNKLVEKRERVTPWRVRDRKFGRKLYLGRRNLHFRHKGELQPQMFIAKYRCNREEFVRILSLFVKKRP